MTTKSIKLQHFIPVLMAFFVMSFADLVGTGVDELKQSADTPRYILQLIPFVAFIWFFLLSVPVGIWQDKIGKKKALNVGILITAIGLFVPIFGNTLPVILIAFALLGIGNTIIQVSANPLLVDIVPTDKASSYMSFSQFLKSIGSMIGPFVAAVLGPKLAVLFGDTSGVGTWRYGLYLFGFIALLSWAWLASVKVEESSSDSGRATLSSCFKLLKNKYVLMMVFGIFLVVGIDVAMNSNIGNFLEQKIGIDAETAKYGKSMYFFAKMIGTFVGAILLTKFVPRKFLVGSSILTIIALTALAFTTGEIAAWIIIFIVSLGVSNIFPLIFSITVGKMPDRSNEISGLMMMAISGGAIIPFIVGLAMDIWLPAGIFVMVACGVYLLFLGLINKEN
ncbi:MAG: MFS transporter [Flavobacteriia bacterium]|nr:MAG: MFS transporter [Flavobacteriia bacterium]